MRFALLVSVGLVACQKPSAPPPPIVKAPEPTPSASASPTSSATAPPAAVARKDPYADLPENEFDQSRIAGFSSDDKYVGYQISTCDPCPAEFHFRSSTLSPIDLAYFYNPALDEATQEKKRAQNDAMVDRKLKSLGAAKVPEGRVLRGPFPADLVFETKVEEADKKGKVTILFGAKVLGEKDAVYPIRIQLGPHPMFDSFPREEKAAMAKMSPEEKAKEISHWNDQWVLHDPRIVYANVTKDGKEIAVVAISGGSMWWETADFQRMKTDDFVAKVREGTAKRHP